MAIPSHVGSNVEIAQHTFSHLISKTNQLIYEMGTVVLTAGSVAQPNATNGAWTSGNTYLQGIFGANTVVVTTGLRGGTHTSPATLNIVSDVNMTASANIAGPNITIGSDNTALIRINAELGTNIVPRDNNTIRIGAPDRILNYVYSDRIRAESEVVTSRIAGKAGSSLIDVETARTGAATSQRFTTYSAANVASTIQMTPTHFHSTTTSTVSLGSTSLRWNGTYSTLGDFSGAMTIAGNTTVASILRSSAAAPTLFDTSTGVIGMGATSTGLTLGGNHTGTEYTLSLGKSAGTNKILSVANTLNIETSSLASGTAINIGGTGAWLGTLNLGRPGSILRSLSEIESTTISNGSAIFSGGVGIAKRLNVGGAASVAGNLNVSGTSNFTGKLTGSEAEFSGAARVQGTLTVDGDLVFTKSDISMSVNQAYQNNTQINNILTVLGTVSSHLRPSATLTYDLGSTALVWKNVYADTIMLKSAGAGFTLFRNMNSQASNATVDLPAGNVVLRTGSVAVLTDKFTDMAGVSSNELRAAVTGTTGTGSLVFGTSPQITSPDFLTSMKLRSGSSATRVATFTNPAAANTEITLPSTSGTMALVSDIGTGALTIAGSNGVSGSATFNANSNTDTLITLTNTDRGSSQNIFKNIANSTGTTQFSASTNNDTIRFEAQNGVSVSFVPASKTVRIGANLTGSTGITITNNDTIAVDSTVIRTVGNQEIEGTKSFKGVIYSKAPEGSNTGLWLRNSANQNAGILYSTDGSDSVVLRAYDAAGVNYANATLTSDGRFTATSFSGSGSLLTGLNASNISGGTIPDARISANIARSGITLIGGDGISTVIGNLTVNRTISVDTTVARRNAANTFEGSQNIVGHLDVLAPTSSGNAEFWLKANDGTSRSVIYSGSAATTNFRSYDAAGSTFKEFTLNGSTGVLTATSFAGSGAGLSSLNASNLSTGTVPDARISNNIARSAVKLIGGDGISTTIGDLTTDRTIAVDNTVIRTTGDQTLGGTKTFSAPQIKMSNPSGAQADPSLQFAAGVGIGYNSGPSQTLALITGGSRRLVVDDENQRLLLTPAYHYSGNGSGLTSLNAGNLLTGTIPDARLSSNVIMDTGTQTIGGTKTFSSTVNAPTFNATSSAGGAFLGVAGDTQDSASFTWSGDTNTGMFRYGDGVIGFACNGVLGARIAAGGFYGDGTNITDLNASNLSIGSVPEARLGNVANFISNMSQNSIGTYALLRGTGFYRPGNTRAGSELNFAAAGGRTSHPGQPSPGPFVAAGTWRCMGLSSSYEGNGDGPNNTTLWLRIA